MDSRNISERISRLPPVVVAEPRIRRRRPRAGRILSDVLIFPEPSDQIVVEDVDDDLCLYRPDTDDVLILNQSAGDVWRLVDGRTDVDGIVRQLAAFYRVEPDHIESDVRAVVDDLARRGFLVEAANGDR